MAIAKGRKQPVYARHAAPPPAPVSATRPATGTRHAATLGYVWAAARLALGWVFVWAFIDKLVGFGFSTPSDRAWIHGGSPTTGFFKGTNDRALGDVFTSLAGQAWADWVFMIGLAAIGTALILGAGMRIAAAAGGLLLTLMWAAKLPLDSNPFIDEHIVYAIVLAGLALAGAGDTLGIGRWWSSRLLVRRYPILK